MLAPCRHCGQACSGLKDVCGGCCHEATEFVCPSYGTSRVYVVFACGISVAVAAVAANGLLAGGDDCTGNLTSWLLGGVACAVLNAVGAVMAHIRFGKEMAKQRAEGTTGSKFSRVCHFMCFDCGVFLYLCIIGGIIYWQVKSSGHHDDCAKAVDALHTAHTLFLVFLLTAPCIATISMCYEMSKRDRPVKDVEHQPVYGTTE